MDAKYVINCSVLLLLLLMLSEYAQCKHVQNITAAIETLMPEKIEAANQYKFEDTLSVPEMSFEFSSGSALSANYLVVFVTQLIHILLLCFFSVT